MNQLHIKKWHFLEAGRRNYWQIRILAEFRGETDKGLRRPEPNMNRIITQSNCPTCREVSEFHKFGYKGKKGKEDLDINVVYISQSDRPTSRIRSKKR